MLTSILLSVALLPANPCVAPQSPGSAAEHGELSTLPAGGVDQLILIRAEAVDEQSEEEEFDGRGPADRLPATGSDVGLVALIPGSKSSPHLRHVRDRRRSLRGPP